MPHHRVGDWETCSRTLEGRTKSLGPPHRTLDDLRRGHRGKGSRGARPGVLPSHSKFTSISHDKGPKTNLFTFPLARSGWQAVRWSRRITDEHRLVYRADNDEIKILKARYHY